MRQYRSAFAVCAIGISPCHELYMQGKRKVRVNKFSQQQSINIVVLIPEYLARVGVG